MLKTAESVSPKHPDKICDQISDSILDAALSQDPYSRVAVETMGGHGQIVIMGEVTSKANLDIKQIAQVFLPDGYKIIVNIEAQSTEIASGVDTGGAGDQGIMVGYATSESPSLTPLEYHLARDLNQTIYALHPYDGKTQITLEDGRIKGIVASFQNATSVELKHIIKAWLKDKAGDKPMIVANPAGEWKIGGFTADTGLTGRKLMVDNYGPHIPVGGGAYSGKDATKVDRSAAYMARKIAVDYLKKHRANEVFTHLAYAIGIAQPVHSEAVIDGKHMPIREYDLTPKGIIEFLKLREPSFAITAEYGHFGRNFTWDT